MMKENRTAERRPCAVLVNDDAEVGRLLASSLAPELEVHVARTIQQAWELFEDLRRVDLAFLDLELPGGDTDELLERLARWPNTIRVLLASALFDDDGSKLSNEKAGSEVARHGRVLKHRHLVHLVIRKPPALPVVQALKSMVLDLPGA
jgi:CheY-like chemotaxis protein